MSAYPILLNQLRNKRCYCEHTAQHSKKNSNIRRKMCLLTLYHPFMSVALLCITNKAQKHNSIRFASFHSSSVNLSVFISHFNLTDIESFSLLCVFIASQFDISSVFKYKFVLSVATDYTQFSLIVHARVHKTFK